MFSGSIVALVTPFKRGQIDEKSVSNLLEFHINSNTNGIVLFGSTGEGTALLANERAAMLKLAQKTINKKIPVIFGASANNKQTIDECIKLANEYKTDGILVVPPFYVKPTQNWIYEYFEYIAKNVNCKVILYNIPSRTSVNIDIQTLYRLKVHKNIVAIKESSGNVDYAAEIVSTTDLTLLSGDDSNAFHYMNLGGKGVISVTANILPAEISKLCSLLLKHDPKSKELHLKYLPISKSLFIETNPAPVKFLMKELALINSEECRFPLGTLKEESKKTLLKYKEQISDLLKSHSVRT
ncbi:MAG: 4-hydroxy-tetrahydrodipicolinate synthase [Planctomycetes bacterium]|nr:4-hydroxy-tetrahydrodipicolinate synthase [Planctomycetota bacterium]